MELLREALKHHCRTQRFLPLPVDVSDAIAAVKERRAARVAAVHRYTPCGECIDGLIFEEVIRDGALRRQARDCECKRQWRAERPTVA